MASPEAPTTTPTHEAAEAVSEAEVFAELSPENVEGAAEAPADNTDSTESTPRFLSRVAYRVANLAQEFGASMEGRRTGSEMLSDLGNSATAAWEGAKASTTERLEAAKKSITILGSKASAGVVRLVTAPARAGERLAKSMESGLNNIEKRAKAAQERKDKRIADRQMKKAIRRQEKEDLAVAKQAKKDIRDREKLAKETERNQAKAERRAEAERKSEAAKLHKQRRKQHLKNMRQLKQMERQDKRDARAERNKVRAEKIATKARKIGKGALRAANVVGAAGKDVATGMGTLFAEAGREAADVSSDAYRKTKKRAQAARKNYHAHKGHRAVKKAQAHFDKTTRGSERYDVNIRYDRDESDR